MQRPKPPRPSEDYSPNLRPRQQPQIEEQDMSQALIPGQPASSTTGTPAAQYPGAPTPAPPAQAVPGAAIPQSVAGASDNALSELLQMMAAQQQAMMLQQQVSYLRRLC
ncbi:unnamed protein product [Phytophthora lilii]|uniref:Unnamed protein product n=1 Tax=Phytophthora lilii TaxID=2077276 RepID=A0A9W6U9K0_9STRA|nr:unnamed protein product [Phytophthora lilii]